MDGWNIRLEPASNILVLLAVHACNCILHHKWRRCASVGIYIHTRTPYIGTGLLPTGLVGKATESRAKGHHCIRKPLAPVYQVKMLEQTVLNKRRCISSSCRNILPTFAHPYETIMSFLSCEVCGRGLNIEIS